MLFVFVTYSGIRHVLIVYIQVTWPVSYKWQELLTFLEHLYSPPLPQFFGGVRVVHLKKFFFALFYYVSLSFEFRVVMFVMISA